MVTKLIRINADDFLSFGGFLMGTFLLIQTIVSAAVFIFFPCDSIFICGMILMVVAMVLCFAAAMGHVLLTFTQAVRFGQTRRRSLAGVLGLIAVETAFVSAVACVLTWVEHNLCPRWWMLLTGAEGYAVAKGGRAVLQVGDQSGVVLWIDSFMSVPWQAIPVLAVAGAVVGFIVGALTQRFGRMGGWLIWGVWMVFFILFPRLPWKTHEVVNWLVPGIGTVALTAFVWSVWSLLHATIKE